MRGCRSPAKGWSLFYCLEDTPCATFGALLVLQLSQGWAIIVSPCCDSSTECPTERSTLACRDIPVPALPTTEPGKASPSPTCGILWEAAWQSACTHTRLNAAVGARMRRNHKLPGQFPVPHLLLPSVPPGVQSHRLEAGTRTGWVSKGNSSLKCTCLVALLCEEQFNSDLVQRSFYGSSKQVVFWLIQVARIITRKKFIITFTSQKCGCDLIKEKLWSLIFKINNFIHSSEFKNF